MSMATGSGNIANVALLYNEVTFHLDPEIHTPGAYEIEIKRGYSFAGASFSDASYAYGGSVKDFFSYEMVGGIAKIGRSRSTIQEKVYINRISSVWNEHPVQESGTALIAVRAKNRSVDQLSCVASGYVPDWDGVGWRNWTTTSNPAPHFVDGMRWRHAQYRLPEALVDNAGIVDWRARCATAGHECDAIFQGSSFTDGARIIASCGYARPYQSEVYGVIEDYDRSDEPEDQIFTPRNTANMGIDIGFPRLPDGFRVRFTNKDASYIEEEAIVLRDGASQGNNLEQVAYEGITTEEKAIARAAFDLKQAKLRSKYYRFTAPAEHIICRRGSIVGLSFDEFEEAMGQARIVALQYNSLGMIEGAVLDGAVPVLNEDDIFAIDDLFAADDIFTLGKSSSAAIRCHDASITGPHPITASGSAANYIEFTSPFTDNTVKEGDLIVVGTASRVYKRAIVFSVLPQNDMTAELVCVDEAPELFAA
jgi:hypothetical protein